jgi:glycosyltransferase involved in cell wall biosynthesis
LILFLGRINRIKGADMLVDAFTLLGNGDARLVIAGPDDGQLREIQAKISRNKIADRVFLPGLLQGEEVRAALTDADLFVLPSRYDAYPTAVMEACQVGIPMVVTDRCEIADLLKDRVAEVVPFDAQAFAEAMKALLFDQDKRNLFKANCQAVSQENFSLKAAVDRLEALYQRVVADRASKK